MEITPRLDKKTKILLTPPRFDEYLAPRGFLIDDPACHALMHYALTARMVYEEHIKNPIVLEGDRDQSTDFRQLWKSIAFLHGVEPERMLPFWSAVKLQFHTMNLPMLPEAYRFEKLAVIDTRR